MRRLRPRSVTFLIIDCNPAQIGAPSRFAAHCDRHSDSKAPTSASNGKIGPKQSDKTLHHCDYITTISYRDLPLSWLSLLGIYK